MTTRAKSTIPMIEPQWVDYAGAVRMTSLGETTLRNLAKRGTIETRRFGRRVMLSVESIKTYTDSLPSAYS